MSTDPRTIAERTIHALLAHLDRQIAAYQGATAATPAIPRAEAEGVAQAVAHAREAVGQALATFGALRRVPAPLRAGAVSNGGQRGGASPPPVLVEIDACAVDAVQLTVELEQVIHMHLATCSSLGNPGHGPCSSAAVLSQTMPLLFARCAAAGGEGDGKR